MILRPKNEVPTRILFDVPGESYYDTVMMSIFERYILTFWIALLKLSNKTVLKVSTKLLRSYLRLFQECIQNLVVPIPT